MSVINPITKREIKIGSATYNKLLKDGTIKVKISSVKKVSAKKTSTKKSVKKASPKKEHPHQDWVYKLDEEGTADMPRYQYYHNKENAIKAATDEFMSLFRPPNDRYDQTFEEEYIEVVQHLREYGEHSDITGEYTVSVYPIKFVD